MVTTQGGQIIIWVPPINRAAYRRPCALTVDDFASAIGAPSVPFCFFFFALGRGSLGARRTGPPGMTVSGTIDTPSSYSSLPSLIWARESCGKPFVAGSTAVTSRTMAKAPRPVPQADAEISSAQPGVRTGCARAPSNQGQRGGEQADSNNGRTQQSGRAGDGEQHREADGDTRTRSGTLVAPGASWVGGR